MRTVRAFAQEEKEQKLYSSRIEHVLQLSYKEALARGVFWASVSTNESFNEWLDGWKDEQMEQIVCELSYKVVLGLFFASQSIRDVINE